MSGRKLWGGQTMKRMFVEQTDEYKYVIRSSNNPNREFDTQKEAGESAKRENAEALVLGERVRRTGRGKPDKWRRL
jgi:hypothetical protein